MAERKVLNKYYPPDFDPEDLPRNKRDKFHTSKVRMMLPMSVRCNTCGEYLYRGKKFNSIKENVLDEEYLGIRIYRFFMRCTRCSSEFTIKTDPKNSDYVAENNCCRNFEPWRQQNEEIEKLEKEKIEEEGDAMKRLENRTMESKIEMDILDGLDHIKNLNSKHVNISYEKIFEERNKKIQEEEEEMIKNVVFQNNNFIRRLKEEDEDLEQNNNINHNENDYIKNNITDKISSTNDNPQKSSNPTKKNDIILKINPVPKKKLGELISPTPQITVKKKRKVDEKDTSQQDKRQEESLYDLLQKPKPKKVEIKKIDVKKIPPKKNNDSLGSLFNY
eukprot:TRINITY_DN255_c1_g1_i1.p1 TRINITY_DN255_c1_g1~~TRINITY_DN255_c1_g1_i1.p1  ORF type:complete len:333 (-),score=119.68 TRINITY_DN255_c1_g1_i1:39-1037(-)